MTLYGTPKEQYSVAGNIVYTADDGGRIPDVDPFYAGDLISRGCIDEAAWLKLQAAHPGAANLTVTDGETTVNPATTLSFSGASVSDAGGGTADVAISGGGLTGFTASLNTTAPNDVINASELQASGGAFPSQDVVIAPVGEGALIATLPTGDSVGGNKRGANAVDLQILSSGKNSATQVASGERSAILGGSNNTASNFYAVVGGGETNTASGNVSTVGGGSTNAASGGQSTVAGGESNTASGSDSTVGGGDGNTASGGQSTIGGGDGNIASGGQSTVGGGDSNTASGQFSWIPGGQTADTQGITGKGAVAAGAFAAAGDAQLGVVPLRIQTTDATPTALTSDAGAAGTTNQVVLPNNSTFGFHGHVVGRVPTTGTSSYWEFKGLIEQGADAASTVLAASVTPSLIAQDAGASGWSIAVTADTTNGALQVTVTGADATTINWLARVETEELIA